MTDAMSQRQRPQQLAELGREPYDLLVLGGGITGAGVARDAVLRGLRVALVERRDFACGTSSRSSKLIHGGIRYLQQGDVGLVLEAAAERRAVRRLAPYLARPAHMMVLVGSRAGYAKLSVGLWTYDRMARVAEDERYRMLDKSATLAAEPLLRPEHLYGAGQYYEFLTDDARLVLANIKRVAALGATVLNYAAATSLIVENGRVAGAEVTDVLGGATIPVRARAVVNAGGPWVDDVRLLSGRDERNGKDERRLHLTKGIHILLRHDRLPLSRIVVMLARDKRAIFAIPRGPVVYIGTTDTDYDGPLDNPAITEEDVTYLTEAVERTFDVPPIRFDEVTGAWAGLRPLLHQDGKKPSELSRKDEVMVSSAGLISVAGGKLTTFRRMAQRVVDMVLERIKEPAAPTLVALGESEGDLLSGGETGADLSAFSSRLAESAAAVPADVRQRLVEVYGSDAGVIAEAMIADPALAERLAPGATLTRGEVEYAVRCEMAATVEDVLERRSRMFLWDPYNGVPEAPGVARVMAGLLGWDEARTRREAEAYEEHVRRTKTFVPTAASAEPRAAHG